MSVSAALGIAKVSAGLIDKLFTSDADRAEAKLKLLELEQSGELTELATAAGVVQAEAKSEHFLTANWRPITMLAFVAIVVNNFIVYPYLSLFWADAPMLEVPEHMWSLLQIGIGGYVVSRGAEKCMHEYSKAKQAEPKRPADSSPRGR